VISVRSFLIIIDWSGDLFFGDFLTVSARVFGRTPEEVIEKAKEISLVLEPEDNFNFCPDLGNAEEI